MDNDNRIKNIIEEKLEDENFLSLLHKELISHYKNKEKVENLSIDEIRDFIIENNYFEKLIPNLNNIKNTIDKKINKNYSSYIYIKLVEGKNIFDSFQNEGESNKIYFKIIFNKKKFKSKKYFVNSNIKINEDFTFQLENSNLEELLKMNKIFTILIISVNNNNKKKVISSKEIAWKYLLSNKKIGLNIDMPNCVEELNESVGIISIYLELFFNENEYIKLLPERLIENQINFEKSLYLKGNKELYEFCKNFWIEFKLINKSFEDRAVKLYFKNELGNYKNIFSYLKIINNRGIDSPMHALRFVSLIPFEESSNSEILNSPLVFLSNKRGNAAEHSVLLFGLLKGFGLDVYLVQGYSSDGGHIWIMTKEKIENKYKIKFWESLTGQILESTDKRVSYLYRKIGSVVNDKYFYANIQENDNINEINFSFDNRSKWKIIEKINFEIKNWYDIGDFNLNLENQYEIEENIEIKISDLIQKFRNSENLLTKFDDKISYILNIALSNYETEKLIGKTYCNNEFSDLIKNNIPKGYTFKAFPIQFTHTNVSLIFEKMRKNPIFKEILDTKGDDISYSIRCKIFNYPEEIFSLWLIIGVKYIEI